MGRVRVGALVHSPKATRAGRQAIDEDEKRFALGLRFRSQVIEATHDRVGASALFGAELVVATRPFLGAPLGVQVDLADEDFEVVLFVAALRGDSSNFCSCRSKAAISRSKACVLRSNAASFRLKAISLRLKASSHRSEAVRFSSISSSPRSRWRSSRADNLLPHMAASLAGAFARVADRSCRNHQFRHTNAVTVQL